MIESHLAGWGPDTTWCYAVSEDSVKLDTFSDQVNHEEKCNEGTQGKTVSAKQELRLNDIAKHGFKIFIDQYLSNCMLKWASYVSISDTAILCLFQYTDMKPLGASFLSILCTEHLIDAESNFVVGLQCVKCLSNLCKPGLIKQVLGCLWSTSFCLFFSNAPQFFKNLKFPYLIFFQ